MNIYDISKSKITQSLVVFDLVSFPVGISISPFIVLWDREERQFFFSLRSFDDRSDEFFHKVPLDETWPVVMDEVDDETFDVRTVLILYKWN